MAKCKLNNQEEVTCPKVIDLRFMRNEYAVVVDSVVSDLGIMDVVFYAKVLKFWLVAVVREFDM